MNKRSKYTISKYKMPTHFAIHHCPNTYPCTNPPLRKRMIAKIPTYVAPNQSRYTIADMHRIHRVSPLPRYVMSMEFLPRLVTFSA